MDEMGPKPPKGTIATSKVISLVPDEVFRALNALIPIRATLSVDDLMKKSRYREWMIATIGPEDHLGKISQLVLTAVTVSSRFKARVLVQVGVKMSESSLLKKICRNTSLMLLEKGKYFSRLDAHWAVQNACFPPVDKEKKGDQVLENFQAEQVASETLETQGVFMYSTTVPDGVGKCITGDDGVHTPDSIKKELVDVFDAGKDVSYFRIRYVEDGEKKVAEHYVDGTRVVLRNEESSGYDNKLKGRIKGAERGDGYLKVPEKVLLEENEVMHRVEKGRIKKKFLGLQDESDFSGQVSSEVGNLLRSKDDDIGQAHNLKVLSGKIPLGESGERYKYEKGRNEKEFLGLLDEPGGNLLRSKDDDIGQAHDNFGNLFVGLGSAKLFEKVYMVNKVRYRYAIPFLPVTFDIDKNLYEYVERMKKDSVGIGVFEECEKLSQWAIGEVITYDLTGIRVSGVHSLVFEKVWLTVVIGIDKVLYVVWNVESFGWKSWTVFEKALAYDGNEFPSALAQDLAFTDDF